MILDERTELADAFNLVTGASGGAGGAGTSICGDIIDLGGTTNYPGDTSKPLYLVIDCDTQIITGGSAGTIQFFVVSDSLTTLGSATVASCTEHARSLAIVTDDATALDTGIEAGTATYLPNQPATLGFTAVASPYNRATRPPILCVQLPPQTYERYLGVLCTIGTTTITAGKVNIFLTQDVSRWRPTADAI